MLRLKFLSENKTEKDDCLAEHGLSIYIETEEATILFDAGQSDIFALNAKIVHADLDNVDAVVISHAHFDHTNGIPTFCRANRHAPIYLHAESFGERYQSSNGKPVGKNIGILWSAEQIAEIRERLVFTDEPVYLTPGIAISGTMDRSDDFTPTERFIVQDEDGSFRDDSMAHEQILVIDQPEGIYIFSGCSHLGVIPAIKQGQKLFPGRPIAGLIVGMHLYETKAELREMIISEVLKYDMGMIVPLHCTGIEAICSIKTRMGDRCIIAGAGDTLVAGLRPMLEKNE